MDNEDSVVNKSSKNKDLVAKIIRIISVPPIMITALVCILYKYRPEYFSEKGYFFVAIALLGIIPALAYPIQLLLPNYKDKGRDGQRKLAFITNLVGYSAAFFWSLVNKVGPGLFIVCSTYFYSVIYLTIFNKMGIKASGHASSFTGSLLILVYSLGLKMIILCVIFAALIIWSSIYLKRHTGKQLVGGILICCLSFLLALFITHYMY